MASLLRNIARKNFFNFREVLKARRLVSFRQTFIKGDVLRVSSNLPAFIDPHKRESHRKQRRNFPYTLFAVLGIATVTANNTEEDSLPTSFVSQSLSVTTRSSPSHQVSVAQVVASRKQRKELLIKWHWCNKDTETTWQNESWILKT